MNRFSLLPVVFSLLAANAQASDSPVALAAHERLITVLATNDMHGAVEPSRDRTGKELGGLAFWAGAVSSVRQGLKHQHGDRAGVLVVDAGDQFQGTLLSNFNEGTLVFKAMNEVGYDAAIPGNHDYDFGPLGWMEDQVTPGSADQNPRGALERLKELAKFPLLSANTFFKHSLRDVSGRALRISGIGCRNEGLAEGAQAADLPIDWSGAKQPAFLQPYKIVETAGVRVALIGIDNAATPSSTTIENVSDLCFRDEVEAYLETRRQLEGQADVFVLIMHNGNTSSEFEGSALVGRILAKGGAEAVHGVAAGHTHWIHNASVQGVPVIQSAHSGDLFGRIDLVWDTKTRRVVESKRRARAGIRLEHVAGAAFEGVPVVENAEVAKLVGEARKELDTMAKRKLGFALVRLTRNRTDESLMANALTDALRDLSGAEISFMNTGGIRVDLPAGDILYENLFEVLPFGNHGVIVDPLPIEKVLALLRRSAATCGAYGALMQSGLRVEFERDCARAPENNAVDPLAKLVRVTTLAGEVLFENGEIKTPGRTFRVVTLDFLAAGGSGFGDFAGTPRTADLGIVRERIADHLVAHPAEFPRELDGRWKRVAP